MAEGHRMTAADLVDKLMSDEHADVLRDSVAWLVTQLMEAEVGELAGAGFGERAPDRRQAQRNGYRPRRWDTRGGELELAIPRSDARRASRCCQGVWLRGSSCGSVRCRAGRRPAGRAMGVCSTVAGCAWFRLHTPRPRASTRGRAERHRSGACPQQARHPRPRPPPSWEGRSMARALGLERANAARDRSAEIPSVGGSSSGHNR